MTPSNWKGRPMKSSALRLGLGLAFALCFAHSSSVIKAKAGGDSDAVAASVLADLIQQGKLTAADGVTNDQLGVSMAVSGNTLVVGAPYAPAWTARGAVYVF